METENIALDPIDATDALEGVEAHLLELLDELGPADWDRPTTVPRWHVRHVAGHLLDTASRKLSVVRDGFAAEQPRSGKPEDIRLFVDRLNAEGVAVYGRLSLEVIRPMMRLASRDLCAWHKAVEPNAPAAFAVSWAGEERSAHWFDTARELTERWHHQEQIRVATGRASLMTPQFYRLVLDCFMRVLPFTYREVAAEEGATVVVHVEGPSGGVWTVQRASGHWEPRRREPGEPNARVTIPEAIAWRLFTKGLQRPEAERRIRIDGDRGLGEHVLGAVAIVG